VKKKWGSILTLEKKMKNIKKVVKGNKGFTMIELIIVIALLGILAAFALPRFASFTTQAGAAARSGVVSSVNSAIAIAHAQWIANGSTGTVTLDGSATPITMNAAGYPDVGVTYGSSAQCQTLMTALLAGLSSGITVGFASPNCTMTGTGWASTVNIGTTSAQ
jgi:MSHA pilin protein MshA